MSKAIYAGSFDPITNGHIDIIKRATKLFDILYVSVSNNYDKNYLFTIEERIEVIQEIFKNNNNIIVEGFDNLLVEYAKENNVNTLIRGLRAVSDFDFEIQMSHTNTVLDPDIETVFYMSDAKYSYLNSSLIKQLVSLDGDVSQFVPKVVETRLKEKIN